MNEKSIKEYVDMFQPDSDKNPIEELNMNNKKCLINTEVCTKVKIEKQKETGHRKWRALKVDILKQTILIVTKCKKT